MDTLIKRDNIIAAWFWTTSINTGPYAENERFDATFVRETSHVVGGGYYERRTFHISGITTAQVDSRREHGGRIIRPSLPHVLAHVIADAHQASEYDNFADWASDHRDSAGTHRDLLNDFEDWEMLRTRHAQIREWLAGEHGEYDEYVKAAQEYTAEH